MKKGTLEFVLISFLLYFLTSNALSDEPTENIKKNFLNKPDKSVFQVKVKRSNRDVVYGTAVFLEKEENSNVAYFVTCYHVLYNSTFFSIRPPGIPTAVIDTEIDKSAITISPHKDYDIVIIRVESPKIQTIIENNQAIPIREFASCDKPDTEGKVIGFPGIFNRKRLFSLPVHINSEGGEAKDNKIFMKAIKENSEPKMRFREIHLCETIPGMSGGLVVDNNDCFAGLIFGRITDMFGLAISSEDVWAMKKEANFISYSPEKFIAPSVVDDKILHSMLDTNYIDDVIRWKHFSDWMEAFKKEAEYRDRFQEVFIGLDYFIVNDEKKDFDTVKNELEFSMRINSDSDNGDEISETLGVWVNGEKKSLHKNGALSLAEHLVPGENLVILKIEQEDKSIKLNHFFNTFAMDVSFYLGGEKFYRLYRSLPKIVKGFPIFVTIRMPQKRYLEYNARLAIRKDMFQEFFNKSPFVFNLAVNNELGQFEGGVMLDKQDGLTELMQKQFGQKVPFNEGHFSIAFNPERTNQMMDIYIQGDMKIEKLKGFGLKLENNDPIPFPFLFRTKVQFIQTDNKLYIPARIISGGVTDDFKIPLFKSSNDDTGTGGFSLDLDVSGLLQGAWMNWTNNAVLNPDEPKDLTSEEIKKMFGLPKEIPIKSVRLFTHSENEHDWLVWLFQIGKKFPSLTSSEEISYVPKNENLWLEFETKQVEPEYDILSKVLPLFEKNGIPAFSNLKLKEGRISIAAHQMEEECVNITVNNFSELFKVIEEQVIQEKMKKKLENMKKQVFLDFEANLTKNMLVNQLKGLIFKSGYLAGKIDLESAGNTTKADAKDLKIRINELQYDKWALENIEWNISADLTKPSPDSKAFSLDFMGQLVIAQMLSENLAFLNQITGEVSGIYRYGEAPNLSVEFTNILAFHEDNHQVPLEFEKVWISTGEKNEPKIDINFKSRLSKDFDDPSVTSDLNVTPETISTIEVPLKLPIKDLEKIANQKLPTLIYEEKNREIK